MKSTDLSSMERELLIARSESLDMSNRFYLLQSKVATVESMLSHKVQTLEKEKVKCDEQRPLTFKGKKAKTVPTADPSQETHKKMFARSDVNL